MRESELQARVRRQLGLRVGPEMAAYILKRLTAAATSADAATFPVMASDARTGIPLRTELSTASLRDDAASAANP